jgi:magnesium-dependent phosphatase 1
LDERWRDTAIAYVSRTEYPQWARACLKLFTVDGDITMDDVGQYQEIYPGSKKTHFRALQQATGIDFEDCLFYDNESWNITDVAAIGVCSVYTPEGMTKAVWEEGLAAFEAATLARREGKKPSLAIGCSRSRW